MRHWGETITYLLWGLWISCSICDIIFLHFNVFTQVGIFGKLIVLIPRTFLKYCFLYLFGIFYCDTIAKNILLAPKLYPLTGTILGEETGRQLYKTACLHLTFSRTIFPVAPDSSVLWWCRSFLAFIREHCLESLSKSADWQWVFALQFEAQLNSSRTVVVSKKSFSVYGSGFDETLK